MKLLSTFIFATVLSTIPSLTAVAAQDWTQLPGPGGKMLQQYLEQRVQELEHQPLHGIATAEQWKEQKATLRRQLQEMLGLSPEPPRGELKATLVGRFEENDIAIERLHLQPVPGLYLTANLFLPKKVTQPLPTILYVCGHSPVKDDQGSSLGNKTYYHHHGAWYARNGYVCMVLDTVQWGEIIGQHWGTYRLGRWWWPARGYTPAGLEAWQGIRALDYLETRPEVDKTRFGVTGRSGGGAYSWWIAALDDRIAATAPTAGIATLRDHVLTGCVEGHCDCMFFNNTHRWDYATVAALVAPRPLLICNTDKDDIFPLDGVVALHKEVRRLYSLLGAEAQLGLQIADGPHKDVQPLHMGEFHWFERFFKKADPLALISDAAAKVIEPRKLRVFYEYPPDQKNTTIDQSFVPLATIPAASTLVGATWEAQQTQWMKDLDSLSFKPWSNQTPKPELKLIETRQLNDGTKEEWELNSESSWKLPLVTVQSTNPKEIVLTIGEEKTQSDPLTAESVRAYFQPRGLGATAFGGDEIKATHVRRRFLLIGETIEAGQVWDIRCAIAALRTKYGPAMPLTIRAEGEAALLVLYASLFQDGVTALALKAPPTTHQQSAPFLNVLKIWDVPQALALGAGKCRITLTETEPALWQWTKESVEARKLDPAAFVINGKGQ